MCCPAKLTTASHLAGRHCEVIRCDAPPAAVREISVNGVAARLQRFRKAAPDETAAAADDDVAR